MSDNQKQPPKKTTAVRKKTQDQVDKQSAPPTPGVVGGYQYPSGFPYESVKEVVRIVRENKVSDEKAAFGKHVWVVQGYAQCMLLGDPDGKLDFRVLDKGASNTDAVVDILDSLMKAHESGDRLGPQSLEAGTIVKMSAPSTAGALLKWTITKLLELVEQELAGLIIL